MWKNLDKNDSEGNPICPLETLHQGNSRQHSSCKDDIDRFKIPFSTSRYQTAAAAGDFFTRNQRKGELLFWNSVLLITTILSGAEVVCGIYLWVTALLQTSLSSTNHFVRWIIVTKPNHCVTARKINVSFRN